MSYVVSRAKSHRNVKLQVVWVVSDLYRIHQRSLLASHVSVILEILQSISSQLYWRFSILELSESTMLHYQNYLDILQDILTYNPGVSLELSIESQLITVCVKILKMYLKCMLSEGAELEAAQKLDSYAPIFSCCW